MIKGLGGPLKWPDLVFPALAFAANTWLLIPLFASLTLHFGQAVALLALVAAPLRAAILSSIAAGLALGWQLGAPLAVPLHLLEILSIAWLLRRFDLVTAAVVFWVLLGIPLNWILAVWWVDLPDELLAISLLKQGINGVLNAAIALSLCVVIERLPRRRKRGGFYARPLAEQVFVIALVSMLLPALVVALWMTHRSLEQLEATTRSQLESRSRDLGILLNAWLERHQSAVEYLARRHRGPMEPELREALELMQQLQPGFRTMLVADAAGNIVHAAPPEALARLAEAPPEQRHVRDRGYFQGPAATLQSHVSDGFQGRGFGSDPIVALSSPIIGPDGGFAGIVEGSLDLSILGELDAALEAHEKLVVLDRAGRVLKASDGLGLAALSRSEWREPARRTLVDVPEIVLGGKRWFYSLSDNRNGWRMVALQSTDPVTGFIASRVWMIVVILGTIFVIGWILSQVIARRVAKPITSLVRQVRDPERDRIELDDPGGEAPELVALARALDEARVLWLEFQHRLEKEVAAKTERLNQLNRRLRQLAFIDPLTGLLNRRGFEMQAPILFETAQRQQLTIALALLDLDDFKQVNDRHGHEAGDRSLMRAAECLREVFRRRMDLCGRLGGDELVVLCVTDSETEARARLEQVRAMIAEEGSEARLQPGLTVSIGAVVGRPGARMRLKDALSRADLALYQSKHSGKNRLTIVDLESAAVNPD